MPRHGTQCITHALATTVIVILWLPTGCSRPQKPPDFGSPEGDAVAKLIVEDLQENVENKTVLERRIFVVGAAPKGADFEKFRQCRFDVAAKPTINGGDATAKIRVRNFEDSKELGVVEWTFTQESAGGTAVWKIKPARMP